MRRQANSHHPDCDAVTDKMLKPLLFARWPADQDGIVRIPYTLFGARQMHPGSLVVDLASRLSFATSPPPEELVTFWTSVIEQALARWVTISNNTFEFYQADYRYQARGLRFNLANTQQLNARGAMAATRPIFDNNGDMRFADIFLPDSADFAEALRENYTYSIQTISHELVHALGISNDWPQDCAAGLTLRQLPDGVFCSVMPYYGNIVTNTSECKIPKCRPHYLMTPGPIDKRMYQLLYNGEPAGCFTYAANDLRLLVVGLGVNAADSMMTGIVSGFSYYFVTSLGTNLCFKEAGEPSLPKNSVYLVADSAMLGAMIYLEIPVFECTVFAITAATKYLPKSWLDQLPEKLQQVVTSSYSLYVVNMIDAIRRGTCLLPLAITTLSSVLGTAAGSNIGSYIGATIGTGISSLVRLSRSTFFQPPPAVAPVEADIELNII